MEKAPEHVNLKQKERMGMWLGGWEGLSLSETLAFIPSTERRALATNLSHVTERCPWKSMRWKGGVLQYTFNIVITKSLRFGGRRYLMIIGAHKQKYAGCTLKFSGDYTPAAMSTVKSRRAPNSCFVSHPAAPLPNTWQHRPIWSYGSTEMGSDGHAFISAHNDVIVFVWCPPCRV